MIKRPIKAKRAVRTCRRRIAEHAQPGYLTRGAHIGPLDQPQGQLFRRLLIGRVQRISHEIVPTRPPSVKMVLPVV